jgi:PPM family protein phosphatase
MPFPVESFARTDVGLYRQNNEDSYLLLDGLGFFALADGMGGHASGEVASYLALETARLFVSEALLQTSPPPREELISKAVEAANQVVYQEAEKHEAYRGMGTTLVALLRDEQALLVAHVGDSRCYRLRDERLEQLTEDHSLRNFYINEYGYTPEQAAEMADGNVILQAIGLKPSTGMDVSRYEVQAGDLYLLCSDGLSDYVEDHFIGAALARDASLEEIGGELIALANAAGGYDNTTVVLVRVLAES